MDRAEGFTAEGGQETGSELMVKGLYHLARKAENRSGEKQLISLSLGIRGRCSTVEGAS